MSFPPLRISTPAARRRAAMQTLRDQMRNARRQCVVAPRTVVNFDFYGDDVRYFELHGARFEDTRTPDLTVESRDRFRYFEPSAHGWADLDVESIP